MRRSPVYDVHSCPAGLDLSMGNLGRIGLVLMIDARKDVVHVYTVMQLRVRRKEMMGMESPDMGFLRDTDLWWTKTWI